jgi:hypothetical protein
VDAVNAMDKDRQADDPHSFTRAEKDLVTSSLEPDQLTGQRGKQLPRRQLKRGQLLILWSLRVYLLFMIAVVFYQIWLGSH